MNLRRIGRSFRSARSTVILLVGLAVLLLLNVVLPQEAVLGQTGFAQLVEKRPIARLLLVTLGLGRISTSPVFLALLALFFLNLIAVLLARIGPTWRRVALKPRPEKGLQAWARLEEALTAPRPAGLSPGRAARTLRNFGYQVRRPGESTLWGVKHRTAPLGFLLFHASFLLLCAGGILVYYTRFVGTVVLSEGQEFNGQYNEIVRRPPFGDLPALNVALETVEHRLERGEPVHLSAVFRFSQAGTVELRTSQVNDPARWGRTLLLVNRAGLASVLWVQDARGFTVDRVVVPAHARAGPPTEIELADGRTRVYVRPLDEGVAFPEREALSDTTVHLVVTRESQVVFDGGLRPGQAATLDDGRLVLEELRYWVGVSVISERGGGLIIAAFVIGTVGLIWRLLWYRREVALTWDETSLNVVGRSEFFSGRFQEELLAILAALQERNDSTGSDRQSEKA